MKLQTTPGYEALICLAQDILVELKFDLVTAVKFSTQNQIVVYSPLGNGEYNVEVINRTHANASLSRRAAFSGFEFDQEEVSALISLLTETGGKFSRFQ